MGTRSVAAAVMKSRSIYGTPSGTILPVAHRGIESIAPGRGGAHLKDEPIYDGFRFPAGRETLQAPIGKNQEFVTGTVHMKLYKGMAYTISWTSPYSLYNQDLVTFEEGAVAHGQRDVAGFIKLNALRLRLAGARRRRISDGR